MNPIRAAAPLLISFLLMQSLPLSAGGNFSGYRDSNERVDANHGIELLLYKKMTEATMEHFSLRNTTSNSISNIKGKLIYKTMEGEVFHQQEFIVAETLAPGAAELTSIKSFDQKGQYSFHMNFDPRGIPPGVTPYMIEIVIQDYTIVEP